MSLHGFIHEIQNDPSLRMRGPAVFIAEGDQMRDVASVDFINTNNLISGSEPCKQPFEDVFPRINCTVEVQLEKRLLMSHMFLVLCVHT